MSEPFSSPQNSEDLHLMMAIAVLSGRRTVPVDVTSIYETWSKCYPQDALGGIGRGLSMIGKGKAREGYRLIEDAARSSKTRADQAQEVLVALRRELSELMR